jgi:predicted aldo/keto reductase-like oxidoreductase
MQYRIYGKTGKRVSAIGFGGMRFENEKDGIEAVRRAAELGVNYFDTAHTYFNGKSEYIIGKGLEGFEDKVYVSNKSMISKDPKSDDVRRRIEKSLKYLGIEKIAFYHMWGILNWEMFKRVIKPGGPYEGALKAKEEGLIEHIAFSVHDSGDEIVKMVNTGLFEGVTLGYNIINYPYRLKGLQAAYETGMGVATMNSLHGGLIPLAEKELSFIREGDNDTVVLAALRFNLSHKEISVALSGMKNIKEVEENVRAADQITMPSPVLIETLKEKVSKWNRTLCTTCDYCQPCIKGIPISTYLSILDRYRIGQVKDAKVQYIYSHLKGVLGGNMAANCDECGTCEKKCTQHLDIMNRLKEVNKIFESGSLFHIKVYQKLLYINKRLQKRKFLDKMYLSALWMLSPLLRKLLPEYEEITPKK